MNMMDYSTESDEDDIDELQIDYEYDDIEEEDENTEENIGSKTKQVQKESNAPKILLMGLKASGKTSIQRVVFQKMSPHETMFLETTTKIQTHDLSKKSFIKFQIIDFPGQIDFLGTTTFRTSAIFTGCGAIIFVLDSKKYKSGLDMLIKTMGEAYKENPKIVFEIFIHKIDEIVEEKKPEIQKDIQERIEDELEDRDLKNASVSLHLTSIFDHTIFEAFSSVIQKLIPKQLPTLENLLNILVNNTRLEKAFIFDVVSKIYIATDRRFVNTTEFELCSDMIDVVIDVSSIYGPTEDNNFGYDEKSESIVKLNEDTVLYFREINSYLVLVCLMQHKHFEKKIGLISYNFDILKKGLNAVFDVKVKK